MVTPFLKTLNNNGGTLYTFPSVSLDLTKTFVSSDYEFKFSHFACLNLPDIYSGYCDDETKGIFLEQFFKDSQNDKDHQITWTNDGMGEWIAKYLQNYVMNFETAILNGSGDDDDYVDYDNDVMSTVSEKVFFNWLQKIGAIKFNGNEEYYTDLSKRTVPYIGDIDIVNRVEVNGDSFEELYLYIPSTVGASTNVYFRDGVETDTKNYLNKDYVLGSSSEKCIIGRTADTYPGNFGMDGYTLGTDPIVDDEDGNIYTGDSGHTIDFRDSSYENGDGIDSMNGNSSEDFEFNAILIYYDLYYKTSETNVYKTSTNLYGILFLDNVTDIKATNDSTDNTDSIVKQGYFQRYPKKKETVYGNGNSFAFKIDIKIDTIPDYTSKVDSYIDPNTPEAMALYEKALNRLQECVDMFYTQQNEIVALEERISKLESMLEYVDQVKNLQDTVDNLMTLYDNNIEVDTDTLQGLIDKNSEKLNAILNRQTDINLQYDMDVVQPGAGVTISKNSTNGKITISANQNYVMNVACTESDMLNEISEDNPIETGSNTEKAVYIDLKPGENLSVISLSDTGDCASDITIYVSDDEYNWSSGQSLKIYIQCEGTLEFTDEDKYGIAVYLKDSKTETFKISGKELEDKNLIEIIYMGDEEFIHLIR